MSSPVKELQDLCDSIVKDKRYAPIFDLETGELAKSHCNEAVTAICEEYGINSFRGLYANEICDFLKKKWRKVDGHTANEAANHGVVAIAGQKADPHGHVAVVYPGAMVWSSHWQKEAPVLANIGRRNAVMGANWAFHAEPTYWIEP